jgi:hypothetical protein
VSGQLHCSAALTPRERVSVTLWIGGWVGPKTGLNHVERRKILPLQRLKLRHLSRPVHSQSLYRLLYPGSFNIFMCKGAGVTNNNGFWIWWLYLSDVSIIITFDYNRSHIELHLNDVCLATFYEEYLTNRGLITITLNSRMHSLLYLPRGRDRRHHIE